MAKDKDKDEKAQPKNGPVDLNNPEEVKKYYEEKLKRNKGK